nr:putative late blight resistance protein homolog R1A-4 isoform X1 [Ipomoea batatas]
MFVPPKLLRVLTFDLSYEFLRRVLVHVKDLVFLRYLSITQWFEGLDHIAANNPNLLTLVVSSNESQSGAPTVHLPSSVWEAPRLRHLELGNTYLVDPPSMVKGNLQSLSCVVTPIHCRKEVYLKLPNIKKLKIFVKDDIEASHTCGSYNNPIFLDDLDYLEKLEKLTVTVSVGRAVTLTERSMFPSQLKKLSLSGTNLSERDLMVIAKLPKLMVLKLKNALHGTVWKLPMGGFTSLKFLLLEDIKLKQWEWVIYDDDKQWEWETCDVDNFPVLEHLVLRFCNHLEKIPLIFAGVYTLQSIVLEECCSSVVASARWILKHRNYRLKLKILGTVYDESQSTDTDEPLDKILLQSFAENFLNWEAGSAQDIGDVEVRGIAKKNDIASLPIEEILSIDVKANPEADSVSAEEPPVSIFLRVSKSS